MDWNGFRGAAKRLDDIDLPREGRAIGVGEDVLHGFIDVESRGRGFDELGRPVILYEPHVAYRCSSGAARAALVKAGLAYPKQGTKPYGKESAQYPKLLKAIEIDEAAALKACSWGMFQVLGENHAMIGYPTVQAMVNAMMADEENHLRACVDFVKAAGIDDDLRRLDVILKTRAVTADECRPVVRVYNGPKYETNAYHTKFAASLNRWRRIPDTAYSPDAAPSPIAPLSGDEADPVPSGADTIFAAPPATSLPAAATVTGDAIAPVSVPVTLDDAQTLELQKKLRALGYVEAGIPNGDFGSKTTAAIAAFQKDQGLPVTGGADSATLARLAIAKPRAISDDRATITKSEIREALPPVKETWRAKLHALWAFIASAVLGAVSWVTDHAQGIFGHLTDANGYVGQAKAFFTDMPGWFWFAASAGVAFVLYRSSSKAEAGQIAQVRSGETAGPAG